MCASTVAVADALPAQPETVIGDSTVERSGICTSVLLVAAHPAGLGDGDGVGSETATGWESATASGGRASASASG